MRTIVLDDQVIILKQNLELFLEMGLSIIFDIDHNTWLSIDSDAVGAFYQDSMQARPRVHNAKTEEFACAENGWRLSTPKGPNNALLYAWDSEQYATLKVKFELSA